MSVSSFNRGESLSFTFEREDTAGTASRDWRDRRSVEGLVKYIAGWDPSAVGALIPGNTRHWLRLMIN